MFPPRFDVLTVSPPDSMWILRKFRRVQILSSLDGAVKKRPTLRELLEHCAHLILDGEDRIA